MIGVRAITSAGLALISAIVRWKSSSSRLHSAKSSSARVLRLEVVAQRADVRVVGALGRQARELGLDRQQRVVQVVERDAAPAQGVRELAVDLVVRLAPDDHDPRARALDEAGLLAACAGPRGPSSGSRPTAGRGASPTAAARPRAGRRSDALAQDGRELLVGPAHRSGPIVGGREAGGRLRRGLARAGRTGRQAAHASPPAHANDRLMVGFNRRFAPAPHPTSSAPSGPAASSAGPLRRQRRAAGGGQLVRPARGGLALGGGGLPASSTPSRGGWTRTR